MARKPVVSGGTRDDIIETAMKFFFEGALKQLPSEQL